MDYRCLATIAVGLVVAFSCGAGELELARRGAAPDCTIVLRADAPENERYAAEELRDWTEKLTGVRLPIGAASTGKAVFLNRRAPDADLGDDGFAIRAKGGSLDITGGRRGVIYGVYEVLERFGGILWLSQDFTHVPEADALAVPDDLDVREKPAFGLRFQDSSVSWGSGAPFAVRSRNNRTAPAPKYGSWYPPFDRELGNCHTFLRMVPPSKYFDAHPEYFSFFKGKRQKDHTQLCLTNPDVFEIVLSNVFARIEANRADPKEWRRMTKYYGISQDDWNGYCECPKCAAIDEREGSHSGCVIWFVNRIAEAVEKRYPDVVIETLAYMYSRVPPKHLKPRRNVMVCLCTIECDFTKPIEENRNEENVRFRDSILKWRKITPELYLWDYIANWRATPSPQPNLRTLARNIRFFRDAGVQHLFQEGIVGPWANFSELKGWISSKLMWNPDQPVAPLIARFVRAYYGKGAPHVLEYIRLLESYPIDETKSAWTYACPVQDLPFDDAFYAKALDLWYKAAAAVADEPEEIRRHVGWGVFGIEYTLADRYAQGSAWRPFIASSFLAAAIDPAEFVKCRDYARRVVKTLDETPAAMVSSRINDARLKGVIHALANAELPKADGADRALVQDWAFSFVDHPKSTTIFRVEDKDACDGKAISVTKDGSGWKVTCRTKGTVAFEKDARYKLRARLKVKPEADAEPNKVLLGIGLYEFAKKKTVAAAWIPAARATGSYEWYDMGEWTAESDDCTIFLDPRDATVSLDCVEMRRVNGKAN